MIVNFHLFFFLSNLRNLYLILITSFQENHLLKCLIFPFHYRIEYQYLYLHGPNTDFSHYFILQIDFIIHYFFWTSNSSNFVINCLFVSFYFYSRYYFRILLCKIFLQTFSYINLFFTSTCVLHFFSTLSIHNPL